MRRNRRTKMRIAIISLLLVLALGVIAAAVLISDIAGDKNGEEITVEISKGASLKTAANALCDAGVIKYPFIFNVYAKFKNLGDNIQYGSFKVNTSMSYDELINVISGTVSFKDTIRVTIPEGYELRHIAALFEEKGLMKQEEFYNIVENGTFDYDFIKDLPKGKTRLEGYLFPDTYEFYKDEKPEKVVEVMLSNFNKKFKTEFYGRAKELNMTVNEVVTLASIIEREAANDSERGLVSSVFHNRLNTPKVYPLLQSCATVQYILKERKPVISFDDMAIDNPYNTYLYPGLPPGPIASPGYASIEAALYPEKSEYNFFLATLEGKTVFSRTFAEHEAAKARYR